MEQYAGCQISNLMVGQSTDSKIKILILRQSTGTRRRVGEFAIETKRYCEAIYLNSGKAGRGVNQNI